MSKIVLNKESLLFNIIKKDMNTNIGELGELIKDLVIDHDIYNTERLSLNSKQRDLGNNLDFIAPGDNILQYLWWNSETQGNWRDAFIRGAFYAQDENKIKDSKECAEYIADNTDDGYIGIYQKDVRFNHDRENGEFWAQSVMFRALLGYYQNTNDEKILSAVIEAVEKIMEAYPIDDLSKDPYKLEGSHCGHSHGLTIVDTFDSLYNITNEQKYLDYAVYLYERFSENDVYCDDLSLDKVLDDKFYLFGHGAHVYEHIRPLIIAAYAKGGKYMKGLDAFLQKLPFYLTPSKGPIGDEFVANRVAHGTNTAYEYCSVQELLHSYSMLMQKSKDISYADDIEWIYYNAALGMRHPEYPSIMYLKSDNCYCANSRHNIESTDENLRFKYSPTHQQSAVCCVPNSGRITPYFVDSTYIVGEGAIKIAQYHSLKIAEEVKGCNLVIEQKTNYPLEQSIEFEVSGDKEIDFDLYIRIPAYCDGFTVDNKKYLSKDYNGEFKIAVNTNQIRKVKVSFLSKVKVSRDFHGQIFYSHGPLVYCMPLESVEYVDRELKYKDYKDYGYVMKYPKQKDVVIPVNHMEDFAFYAQEKPKRFDDLSLKGKMYLNGETKDCMLKPMAYTILRKTTFEIKY